MVRPLSIRGSLGKQMFLVLGGLAFIAVGGMMLILPPPASSLLGWSTPVGRVAQEIVGFLALLLGGVALAVWATVASRPILLLYPDRLVDIRRKLEVPFTEIRELTVVRNCGVVSVQSLLLWVRDPENYAGHELTLDLSLASAADLKKARQFIAGHIRA